MSFWADTSTGYVFIVYLNPHVRIILKLRAVDSSIASSWPPPGPLIAPCDKFDRRVESFKNTLNDNRVLSVVPNTYKINSSTRFNSSCQSGGTSYQSASRLGLRAVSISPRHIKFSTFQRIRWRVVAWHGIFLMIILSPIWYVALQRALLSH